MHDVLYQQIAHLNRRMGDPSMIDPVEFGEIKGAVASLQLQMSDFKARQAVSDAKLDLVLDKLSEAKGGWRVMMLLGGGASVLGSGLTWLITNYRGHP